MISLIISQEHNNSQESEESAKSFCVVGGSDWSWTEVGCDHVLNMLSREVSSSINSLVDRSCELLLSAVCVGVV